MAALYNIERPSTLSEVVGQENIKRQLYAAGGVDSNLQSMLFIGPRGTGKTSIARIWAKTVNCENPKEDGSPCGECPTCRAIAEGACMDVVELDAASNNGVEDVHRVIEQAQFAPAARKKVFILDEVHMFTTNAWNALLKTIEEPPADCVFILCTTEEQKVPATIISRCRKFLFERLGIDVVKEHLQNVCDKHGKCADSDALTLIARASDGCMRDALSILESFFDNDNIITDIVASTLGLSDEDKVFDCLEAIQNGDPKKAISAFREASKNGGSVALFVKSLIVGLTDALYLLQGASVESILNTSSYKERVAAFKDCLNIDRCMELTSKLSDVYGGLNRAVDAEFLVEAAILQTLSYESELELLKKRVEALEKGIAVAPSAPVEVMSGPSPEQKDEPMDDSEAEFFDQMADEWADAEDDPPFDVTDDIDADLPVAVDSGFGNQSDTVQPAVPVDKPADVARAKFHVVEQLKPSEPVQEPVVNTADDILDLLPKGTKVVGMEQLEEAVNGKNEDAAETETNEPEPKSVLPGFGFDGLDGWL